MVRAARRIVMKLRSHGHEAYFAGGWVRDHLLGRRPEDIDLATSASPAEVRTIFPRSRILGERFGVVQVFLYRHAFEVTSFRSEGPYLDGRHPSHVRPATAQQDAQRRDFTVNGLFYDPVENRVLDFVQGQADLRKRMLRTIGDARSRFGEDKLRLLRCLRLACALDFRIAEPTWEAILELAPAIGQVSRERIRDELLKVLTGPDAARGLDLLRDSGLLKEILPEVDAMRGVPQPPDYHPEGDVYVHTRQALALLRRRSPTLALGTLLHDVGKPPTLCLRERIRFDGHVEVGARLAGEICRRLRMSNDDTEQVVDLVRQHLRFMNVHEMRESTLRRFLRRPNIDDHLEMHRVDCLSSHRDLSAYHFCRRKLRKIRKEPPAPPRLLTGHDLIELGYRPGPLFGRILRFIEDLQLEQQVRTREEALEQVRSSFPLDEAAGPRRRKTSD